MAFTCCILFTRYTREQNTTCKGHLVFQKGHQFHWKMTFIVFCVPSLTFFIMNVENKQCFIHEFTNHLPNVRRNHLNPLILVRTLKSKMSCQNLDDRCATNVHSMHCHITFKLGNVAREIARIEK